MRILWGFAVAARDLHRFSLGETLVGTLPFLPRNNLIRATGLDSDPPSQVGIPCRKGRGPARRRAAARGLATPPVTVPNACLARMVERAFSPAAEKVCGISRLRAAAAGPLRRA